MPSTVFLPGQLHGQRSLAGYSPWGHQELDTTEHAHVYTHTNIYTLIPTKYDVIVSLKELKTTLRNFHISSKTLIISFAFIRNTYHFYLTKKRVTCKNITGILSI